MLFITKENFQILKIENFNKFTFQSKTSDVENQSIFTNQNVNE